MQSSSRSINLLLVEDDPGDVELTREGLRSARVEVNMHVVDDGDKALQYLRKQGPYRDASRPDMVLLDINMPKMNGKDVLREIRKVEALKDIPVVILTTSEAEADITDCYRLGANSYITKPVGYDAFSRVMAELENFWFKTARMPKHDIG
jgi:two-component system, chemotaxis family, response regulator Rcp1